MNVKKIIGKLEIKEKYILMFKTDKDEYVKSIIYLDFFFFGKKNIGINNK